MDWLGAALVSKAYKELATTVYKAGKTVVGEVASAATYPWWSRERKEKSWDYHHRPAWGSRPTTRSNPYRKKVFYGPKTAKQAGYSEYTTKAMPYKRKRGRAARRPRRKKTYRKKRYVKSRRRRRKTFKRTTYAQPRRTFTSGIRIWTNQSGGQSLSTINEMGSMQFSCGNTTRLNALMDIAHTSPTDKANMWVKKGYMARTLHNAGTNKVHVTAYFCKPRRRLNATANTVAIFVTAATHYYGSDVTLQPTCVPGDLPHFLQRFNIFKSTNFTLPANGSKTLSLSCGPFWHNEGDFDSDPFEMDRRTSAILVRFHGQVAQDQADEALSGYSIARINWIQNEKYYFHSGVEEEVGGTLNDNYLALAVSEIPGKEDIVSLVDYLGPA